MTTLLDVTITTAVTGQTGLAVTGLSNVKALALQAAFDYGSGGTTAKAYVQTSLDGGTTWVDIAAFAFTTSDATKVATLDTTAVTTVYTPTDGSLADDTVKNGILGDRLRVKYTTTGTYAGDTTLKIHAIPVT